MKRLISNSLLTIAILCAFFLSGRIYAQEVKNLKRVNIASLDMYLDSTFLRLPGYNFPIALVINSEKNVLYTKGLGGGKVRWSNFNVRVKGGSFSNGKIYVSDKLLPGDYVEVIAISKAHPTIKISRLIRLNYINDMNLYSLGTFPKIPGERFNFGIKVRYDNGCKENITSWSHNYKLINSLKLEFRTSGGEVKSNRFIIDSEIDNINAHTISLVTSTPRSPYISDSLSILLDYKGNYTHHVVGGSGFSGNSGFDGSSGTSGSSSQCGSSGTSGSSGQPGDNGHSGYDLDVFCDAYFDSILQAELLYLEVEALQSHHIKKYLINPEGGSIDIISSGGSGGTGGRGGNGGLGGSGGSGTTHTREIRDTTGVKYETYQDPGGCGGNGGHGGDGGYGGNGGRGGDIFIYYTPKAEKYLSCIHAESRGGQVGSGGFGGSGGSGGTGGSPGGSSGSSGSSGSTGDSGYEGQPGVVKWFLSD